MCGGQATVFDKQLHDGATWRCLEAGTLVLMADGTQKPIEKIKRGERVMGLAPNHTNSLSSAEVLRVENTGLKAVKQIVTERGNEIVASLEHRFPVRRGAHYRNVEVGSLKVGDELKATTNFPDTPAAANWLLSYLKGAFAGDGHIMNSWFRYQGGAKKRRKSVLKTAQFSSVDKEFANLVLLIAKDFFKIQSKLKQCERRTKAGKKVFRFSSTNTQLCEFIESGPITDEKGYLAGFFDAEGHASASAITISQKGKIPDAVLQALSNEFFKHDVRFLNGMAIVCISTKLADRFLWTFKPRIKRKWEWMLNRLHRQKVDNVKSITSKRLCYEMEVSGSHTYVANNILTHNCDTIEVWWKGERYSVEGLLELFKQQGYLQALKEGAHLIITGGEPLIQQEAAAEFLESLYLKLEKHVYVEVETNGTIIPQEKFSNRVSQWNVSPKLKNSGMPVDKRIKLQAMDWFAADPRAFFKFVVADLADVNEVEGAFLANYAIRKDKVFLMPAASDRDTLRSREDAVSMYALALGVNYSSRLQVQIWNMTTGV